MCSKSRHKIWVVVKIFFFCNEIVRVSLNRKNNIHNSFKSEILGHSRVLPTFDNIIGNIQKKVHHKYSNIVITYSWETKPYAREPCCYKYSFIIPFLIVVKFTVKKFLPSIRHSFLNSTYCST